MKFDIEWIYTNGSRKVTTISGDFSKSDVQDYIDVCKITDTSIVSARIIN